MKEEKIDLILASGIFDYGNSVSGNYIMYRILKSIPNLKFKVLPFFSQTSQKVDTEDFIKVNSLDELPSHRILFATGDDLTEEQIRYICKKYNSKYMTITMAHWMYSNGLNNTFPYPELDENWLKGENVERRLRLYREVNAEIVVGSSHSKSVHEKSLMKDLPCHLIPFPFEEIDIDDSYFEKSNTKTILWGTTQPETPRKGKKEFEHILEMLYDKCENPNDITISYIGPPTNINTKFRINNYGIIPNRKELSKIYRNSTVFALTTLSDAGPMMAVECLKNKTPLVSFNTNISIDIVNEGKNGYVVTNKEEYVDKLYQILFEGNYHMDMDYIKEFNSFESVTKKYKELFEKIMKS
jgi:glycosyltransferase involved in cell wall biosynthesis